MTEYSERTLGTEAIGYIRQRLSDGKTFAKHLLTALDLERGAVVTYLPTKVTLEDALQFKEGQLPRPDPSTFRYDTDANGVRTRMEPTPNTDPWLVSVIQSSLASDENRVCIFEESTWHPSDPLWATNKSDIVTFIEDEVYYVLLARDAETKIHKALRRAGGAWPGLLAAMTSTTGEEPISSGNRNLRRSQLKTLAERTERLAVGAYDGESYLIWSKPQG